MKQTRWSAYYEANKQIILRSRQEKYHAGYHSYHKYHRAHQWAQYYGVLDTLTHKQVREFFAHNPICFFCEKQPGRYMFHHILLGKGGTNTIDNIGACCWDCLVARRRPKIKEKIFMPEA